MPPLGSSQIATNLFTSIYASIKEYTKNLDLKNKIAITIIQTSVIKNVTQNRKFNKPILNKHAFTHKIIHSCDHNSGTERCKTEVSTPYVLSMAYMHS